MRTIKSFLLVLLTLFLYVNNVYAESCELNDERGFCLDMTKHNAIAETTKYFGEDAEKKPGGTYFKVSNNDEIIYCSNVMLSTDHLKNDLEPIDQNCREKSAIEKSIIYLYEYGYGSNIESGKYKYNSKYLYGNDVSKDYYITQSAVWYFYPPDDDPSDTWLVDPNDGGYDWNTYWFNEGFDFTNGTYYGKKYDMVSKISALVVDAKAASNATPSLELTSKNTIMNVTSDGNYYISDAITLTGKYLTDSISLSLTGTPDAFITTNKEATSGITTLSDGTNPSINEVLYIKVPVTSFNSEKSNITLKVTSKSSFTDESTVIECNPGIDKFDQSMIKYNPNTKTLSKEITVTANKYPVKVSKTDASGNPLEGATLIIKQGDKVIESWNTSTEVKTILLSPGIYTLSETKAPNGYILNHEVTTFTVGETNEEIKMINEPITITVSKRSVKSSKELTGATLRITDEKGNIVKDILGENLEWVTTEKPKVIHIAAGTYILEEIKSPEGYELSDKKIEFTVHENGKVTIKEGLIVKKDTELENNLIVFENSPEPKQVPTGNTYAIMAAILCTVSLGVATYFILKRKEI